MFEIYRAAMRLSQNLCPAYTFAMTMPDLGINRVIKMAQALQPRDGLTHAQRAWRQTSMSDTAKAHRFAQVCIPEGGADVLPFPDRTAVHTPEEK